MTPAQRAAFEAMKKALEECLNTLKQVFEEGEGGMDDVRAALALANESTGQ